MGRFSVSIVWGGSLVSLGGGGGGITYLKVMHSML